MHWLRACSLLKLRTVYSDYVKFNIKTKSGHWSGSVDFEQFSTEQGHDNSFVEARHGYHSGVVV